MASAAEQLAANLNLGVFSKATELKRRIWFTLGALIVYRIGTYIPVPGVDASVMTEMLQQHGGGRRVGAATAAQWARRVSVRTLLRLASAWRQTENRLR